MRICLFHSLTGHIALSPYIVKQLPPFANGAYIGDLIRRRYPNLGDAFYLDTWPFASLFLVISSPEMVYQMTKAVQLLKARTLRTFLQPLTGREDLVTLEGDTWKRWRRIFSPGFSAARVSSLIPGMVEEAEVFKNALMEHANKGDLFHLEHLTLDLTIDIIGRVVM